MKQALVTRAELREKPRFHKLLIALIAFISLGTVLAYTLSEDTEAVRKYLRVLAVAMVILIGLVMFQLKDLKTLKR